MSVKELNIEMLEQTAEMLKAIAHPLRIAIIDLLENEEQMSVTDIYEKLNIEQSVASHHLGILKSKGALISKRTGKNIFYSLKHESIKNIVNCMKQCSLNK